MMLIYLLLLFSLFNFLLCAAWCFSANLCVIAIAQRYSKEAQSNSEIDNHG
jgi:hypothetical protein